MNLSKEEKKRIQEKINKFDPERIMEIRELIHYGINERSIKTMGYKDDEIQEAINGKYI